MLPECQRTLLNVDALVLRIFNQKLTHTCRPNVSNCCLEKFGHHSNGIDERRLITLNYFFIYLDVKLN